MQDTFFTNTKVYRIKSSTKIHEYEEGFTSDHNYEFKAIYFSESSKEYWYVAIDYQATSFGIMTFEEVIEYLVLRNFMYEVLWCSPEVYEKHFASHFQEA